MPTSLCWKGKAIVCGKVKSKSRHGVRKHDRTGLHPSPSQRLSPTAQHPPPLQPLGPASGFQPLPTRLLSGVGPLRLTPGQRTPSGVQPSRTPPLPPVRSLHYFLPVLDEISSQPLPPGYLEYLEAKLRSAQPRPAPQPTDPQQTGARSKNR